MGSIAFASSLKQMLVCAYASRFRSSAMHKRGLSCHAVAGCLSVCLSVTFVYCVETAKDMAIVAMEYK